MKLNKTMSKQEGGHFSTPDFQLPSSAPYWQNLTRCQLVKEKKIMQRSSTSTTEYRKLDLELSDNNLITNTACF